MYQATSTPRHIQTPFRSGRERLAAIVPQGLAVAAPVMVPASTFRDAVDGLIGKPEVKATLLARITGDKAPLAVHLCEEEKPLLQELMKLRLAKTTRTRITQYLHQVKVPTGPQAAAQKLQNILEEKPEEFDVCLNALMGLQGKMFEIKVMDRWYLFRMPKLEMAKSQKRIVGFVIRVKFQMVRTIYRVTKVLYRENFKDAFGKMTLGEILNHQSIRAYDLADDHERDQSRVVSLAIGLAEDYGKQVFVRGPVLEVKTDSTNNYYGGDMSWETLKHIYEREKGVVEPELELSALRRPYWGVEPTQAEEPDGVLPFIRVFSLRTRTFLYTDFRNTEIYKYLPDVEQRLVLKPAHRRILTQVFAADEGTIKDLIPGKTGGLCILAWGNPGVGKTLTAEVYAEIKERPLYSLSVSEIGTQPQEIEKNLQRVFTRVERWNAVLLFDECDVFLSARGNDIHQSAVVGMFLRLMDYYSGTMFLTTNRLTVVDEAVDSRLAFRIHYDDLGPTERKCIWKTLLEEARIACTPEILERLAELKLDGRKIRNAVRAVQLNKTKDLTWEVIEFLLPYISSARPDSPQSPLDGSARDPL
jgi:hypothetical protein